MASTADVEPVAEAKVAWGVRRGRHTDSTWPGVKKWKVAESKWVCVCLRDNLSGLRPLPPF